MASEDSDDGHTKTRSWKKSPKVVIIGAGISGISAGNLLASNGITDFVILEASDRVGGRIWSIDLGRFLHILDLHSLQSGLEIRQQLIPRSVLHLAAADALYGVGLSRLAFLCIVSSAACVT